MGIRSDRSSAVQERDLRERALGDAAALFHAHGRRAIAMVSDRLIDPSRDAAERRCDRLTLLAIERLDREQRQGIGATALIVWQPPLLSRAGLAGLFGIKLKPKRRR